MRWLWTAKAIQCHLMFGTVGAIFVSLFLGDPREFQKFLPGNDWIWLALFLVLGYPLVLFLLWLEQRSEQREAVRAAIAAATEPEQELARRVRWRGGFLVALAVLGVAAIHFGNQGWRIEGIPAQYAGYFLLGLACLGLCGVNIWYGGPLDRRLDPQIGDTVERDGMTGLKRKDD